MKFKDLPYGTPFRWADGSARGAVCIAFLDKNGCRYGVPPKDISDLYNEKIFRQWGNHDVIVEWGALLKINFDQE